MTGIGRGTVRRDGSAPGRGAGLAPATVALAVLPVLLGACEPQIGWQGGPAVGDPAPSYTVETLSGEAVSLDDFRGRPLLLNFWATWCTPCRTETPFLQSLYEAHRGKGLQVVGVSMDSPGSLEDIREFTAEMGVTYDVLYDPRQVGMDRFSLIGLPATYVLDSEGEIRFFRVGPVSEGDQEFLDTLYEVTS